MMMKRWLAPLAVAVCVISCTKELIREDTTEKTYRDGGRDQVRRMVRSIDDYNARALTSYTASFTMEGSSGGKTFKALGSAIFAREARLMNITFSDFYFRTTIGRLFQEGDQIGLYFPMDKRLVLDNTRRINLRNYTEMALDYDIIMGLATGMIPLVPGYRVRQGLEATDGSESLLVMENRDYQQTIAFKGSAPVRMTVVERQSREPIVFYLGDPVQQGTVPFFRTITVVAGQSAVRLKISFTNVMLNAPVQVPLLKDLKLPSNVVVVRF